LETIAVDLMGGDKAPDVVARGVAEAIAEVPGVAVALLGTKKALAAYPGGFPASGRVTPYEAPQVVGMAESPTDAWRTKKDSSIGAGVRLVQEGKADAFFSAGNTGAVAAMALLTLGTMEGIERPALATMYRTPSGSIAMILDVGANVDCRPSFLLQFAQMGSAFMGRTMGVAQPKVGLLSNGEEEEKGSRLVKETHKLLKESGLNFIGNVEGFDLVTGKADVVVTDGFTGNVALKLAEALTTSIFMSLRDALGGSMLAKASKILWGPPIMGVVKQWRQTNVGGAPLLGVRGNIVIGHGRSEPGDIRDGIVLAQRMVKDAWRTPDASRVLGKD
jgi:glycerol-3-phosphate acyltransferase PlsX